MIRDKLQALVDKQAEDEVLWSVPFERLQPITEAYLQQELRKLHAAVEARTSETEQPDGCREAFEKWNNAVNMCTMDDELFWDTWQAAWNARALERESGDLAAQKNMALDALNRALGWIPDMNPDRHAVIVAIAALTKIESGNWQTGCIYSGHTFERPFPKLSLLRTYRRRAAMTNWKAFWRGFKQGLIDVYRSPWATALGVALGWLIGEWLWPRI